jgi:hypothetical protein
MVRAGADVVVLAAIPRAEEKAGYVAAGGHYLEMAVDIAPLLLLLTSLL